MMKYNMIRLRRKYSFSVILLLLVPEVFAQTIEQPLIPCDTSITPYQSWIKIKKDFPEAKIVYPQLPGSVKAEYDIVYSTLSITSYGKRDLHLDLFRPEKPGRYPALILVHGGGWRSGNRSMQVPLAQNIAAQDYVTACVEYRLSPEALYPAAVYDLKAAIRFLRANASKYNIDADRIAISGSSAGGQLAALAGMTSGIQKFDGNEGDNFISTKVQAIIDMDGILDFTDPNESAKDNDPSKHSAAALWFGATFKEDPEKWIEASPIVYAGKNTPPMLFVNSSQPRFLAGRDSLIKILDASGIYSEVHTSNNSPHPFWLFHPWFEPASKYMVDFLDKIFKSPLNENKQKSK
jgi:pectinesterase